MNYDYIGDDNSVIEQCLIVQEPFWNFESSINGQNQTMYLQGIYR